VAVSRFEDLTPAYQRDLFERAVDTLTPDSQYLEKTHLLRELDRLLVSVESEGDEYDKRSLERVKKGPQEGVLRCVLRRIPLDDLMEDPVWPSLLQLMMHCSGFCWGNPQDEDPKHFWPQLHTPEELEAILARLEEPVVECRKRSPGVEAPEPKRAKPEEVCDEPLFAGPPPRDSVPFVAGRTRMPRLHA
jgi:hypothetical protein